MYNYNINILGRFSGGIPTRFRLVTPHGPLVSSVRAVSVAVTHLVGTIATTAGAAGEGHVGGAGLLPPAHCEGTSRAKSETD